MGDAITNTAGSEKLGTKTVVIVTSIIGVLGTLTTVIDALTNIIPTAQKGLGLWLAISGTVIAALTQIAYTISRTIVKTAAIQAGTVPATVPADPAIAAANVAK